MPQTWFSTMPKWNRRSSEWYGKLLRSLSRFRGVSMQEPKSSYNYSICSSLLVGLHTPSNPSPYLLYMFLGISGWVCAIHTHTPGGGGAVLLILIFPFEYIFYQTWGMRRIGCCNACSYRLGFHDFLNCKMAFGTLQNKYI